MKKSRQHIYQDLMACAGQSPNRVWLAQIIASWSVGDGVLPDSLGLSSEQFQQLLDHYFPGYPLAEQAYSGSSLDYSRMLEKQDLEILLVQFASQSGVETEWLIAMIVSACLGNDHLWQDLGLWSRSDLSALLAHNFPELVNRNSKDMKWKKFLYKQLCEAEGLYVCRAPSCEVCKDYQQCFGPED
ncbi:nitrogen fixation protein NifQ [Methylomonas montana]|uniref:nitrogen fixation protein NifQ n=1 Tax=Methylomonas montana TaxID=3058963 RepID=UPI0026594377|nr:nitrogen fixation protein NifQ [Methylomonas montana]WKJ91409.1 nitrogen fixation protein NifQ [Methylomonas montana]